MQRNTIRIFTLALVVVISSGLFILAGTDETVPYPTGYLKWTHIKQATQPAQGSAQNDRPRIYHIYANETAVEGYRNKQFADGAVLVVDFFDTKEENGKLLETSRTQVAVMVKDNKRYAKTGGWGFGQFKGDNQTENALKSDGAAKCYACHSKQGESGVFTTYNK